MSARAAPFYLVSSGAAGRFGHELVVPAPWAAPVASSVQLGSGQGGGAAAALALLSGQSMGGCEYHEPCSSDEPGRCAGLHPHAAERLQVFTSGRPGCPLFCERQFSEGP